MTDSILVPETYDFHNLLNFLSSILMILIGIVGVVCNLLIVYIFIKASSERTSFNLICVFRGVGNTIIMAWAFVATFVPITFFGDSTFSPYYQTFVLGVVNSIYSFHQQTSALIAINRFCSLYFPIFYAKVFSIWGTLIVLLLMSSYKAYVIVSQLTFYLPIECYMTFSSNDLTWSPTYDTKCKEEKWGLSALSSTYIWIGLLVVLNVATFFKIYRFYKSTTLEKERVDTKIRKNQVLFLQTVIQDVLNLMDMLFTFKLSMLSSKRWWTFISGSLVWESVHAADGLIMILFNERLTFLKKSFFPSSANASGKVFSVTNTAGRRVHPVKPS